MVAFKMMGFFFYCVFVQVFELECMCVCVCVLERYLYNLMRVDLFFEYCNKLQSDEWFILHEVFGLYFVLFYAHICPLVNHSLVK